MDELVDLDQGIDGHLEIGTAHVSRYNKALEEQHSQDLKEVIGLLVSLSK